GAINGIGGEMEGRLVSSATTTTLVSPSTPPSAAHYPLMEATTNSNIYNTGEFAPPGPTASIHSA
ncbi:hypothetical protein SK128_015048, partial [Halocaridina rubra]